tara:strand:+ start:530 stop:1666 length:1137 start_codon:yes stop_codon:yes gene_type:complete
MKKNNLYIGILTGTSMDSIDCGIYNFKDKKSEIVSFSENIYPLDIKEEINNNLKNIKDQHKYKDSLAHRKLGVHYSEIINNLLNKNNIKKENISAIGMHGQTVSHTKKDNQTISIQIGCPKALSEKTNIRVVSDFRQDDIENGGEGAPLAPLFHDYVFNKLGAKRAIVNIGGISNISFLTSNNNSLYGFDSGPGNTLIDSWVKDKYNLDYDISGNIAKSHNSIDLLLKNFMMDKYFQAKFPKSTSTEYFSREWLSENLKVLKHNYSDGDILSTLTNLTAFSIIQGIADNYKDCDEIYVCGGGAFNKAIIAEMELAARKRFSRRIILDTTDSLGVNPKTVESGLFAWLAMSRINNLSLDYTNITGSNTPKTLGTIYTST